MIGRLSYVCCDRCGAAAAPADDAIEARALAREAGFRRVAGNTGATNQDVCRRCRTVEDRVIKR